MAAPVQKPGEHRRLLTDLPLDLSEIPIRLTQADTARLLGCSRAWISGLVSRGTIPTRAGGKIDPSEAVAALLRADPDQHRLKALVEIRARIDDAEARAAKAHSIADQAQVAAAQATRSLAELRGHIVTVTRKLMEAERRIDVLVEEFEFLLDDETRDEELMTALERAFDRAAAATDGALFEHLVESDEDLAALVAAIRPDLAPPPPPALREAITEALEGEPLPLQIDPQEQEP